MGWEFAQKIADRLVPLGSFALAVIGVIAVLAALSYLFGHVLPREKLRYGGGDKRQWRRAKRGEGLGVGELARRLNMNKLTLSMFQPKYQEAFIRKRRGGMRRLLVPGNETKALQRRVLRRVLKKLRVHGAAQGFERGRSIVHNALPHTGRCVLVKLDLVDFFPSTSAERVERYFRRVGWDAEAAALLTRLTTHEGGLPQGAPTSPRLSNLVNFYLDVQLTNVALRRKGVYTRYADDLTFSFPRDHPRKMRGVVDKTRRILKSKGYRLHKKGKLRIVRRHQQQRVTGLVVNDKVQLPRATRRWLRAVEHHVATGRPATLTEAQLAGWRALTKMIAEQRRVGGAQIK